MGDIFNEEKPISKDKLTLLSDLCKRKKDLEKDIERKTKELEDLGKKLQVVSRVSIPTLFQELGISSIGLDTGEMVEVSDELKASIADKNYIQAYQNMIAAEKQTLIDDYREKYGVDAEISDELLEDFVDMAEDHIEDLFKSQTIIDNADEETLDTLLDNDIPYELKRSIHWQTLKKYVQGRLDKGLTVPEGITVFQYQETKIK